MKNEEVKAKLNALNSTTLSMIRYLTEMSVLICDGIYSLEDEDCFWREKRFIDINNLYSKLEVKQIATLKEITDFLSSNNLEDGTPKNPN
jgi:hypothetical protein